MALSNLQLWNELRKKYPKFASETAEGTADLFTENGFGQLKEYNPDAYNDFYQLSMRVFLQKIDVANVKDVLADQGFGEDYTTPFGGFVQRMAIASAKPVSPAFKGLENGSSVDPFVVRKMDVKERFFQQNFDYQSLMTMPDEGLYRNIFISEFGMSEYQAGAMKALQNGYTLQVYNNKLEAINAAINSVDFPLQDTQQFSIAIANMDASTMTTADKASEYASQFIAFIQLVRNIVDSMIYTPATGAYNAAGFETTQDRERLKMLVRPDLANAIAAIMKLNNTDDMSLPVDIVKVPCFGGLKPFKEAAYATPLYPVYDTLGSVIGYNEKENQTEVTVLPAAVYWKDPNASIIAILADKGVVFTNTQTPYSVEPVRNPRGLYTNFWASSVNNAIVYDTYYNLVTIENSANAGE